jgi:ATP-dependent Lhr-like helicase
VRGYVQPLDLQPDDEREPAEMTVCRDLYQFCPGDSHLVFANSCKRTEGIANVYH